MDDRTEKMQAFYDKETLRIIFDILKESGVPVSAWFLFNKYRDMGYAIANESPFINFYFFLYNECKKNDSQLCEIDKKWALKTKIVESTNP